MRTLLSLLLVALFSVQTFSKTLGYPTDDITVAIAKAKEHVLKEKIDVKGFFIQKVEFKNQYEELVPQFWEITFIRVPQQKGGYLFVHVFNVAPQSTFLENSTGLSAQSNPCSCSRCIPLNA